ncbi:hypothetical protein [Paracnuella aquatica]|uniref:hypothetical protein n=1 Tax=Paracnuella aquatica TaxID=2268757 RepID=UPI00158A0D2B|nr:hypothetical protein [Paracnuella aquatica]
MVTVKNYHVRQNAENKPYVSLELVGDLEMVQSQNTGRFYATQRRCFIYSTFDAETAKLMVGKSMPGAIVRTSCDPYEYTIPETGEVVLLAYRYTYVPEEGKAAAPQAPVVPLRVVPGEQVA